MVYKVKSLDVVVVIFKHYWVSMVDRHQEEEEVLLLALVLFFSMQMI